MPGLNSNKLTLTIIGASGHGKVIADIAKLNGYKDIVFLDDDESVKTCGDYSVVGTTDAVSGKVVFIAIGSASIRRKLMEKYSDKEFPVLIHPNATIADDVRIGEGSVVMAGAVINPGTTIGKGCIVNTCSSVDHDCNLGDYVHVSVGTHLCGTVNVGDNTWIGAGAIVKNNIMICEDCMIGAGAVVVNNLNETGTYVGVPARKIK